MLKSCFLDIIVRLDDLSKMKRTEIHDVALEIIPIDLVAVEFDQSPIFGEFLGAGIDGYRWGVEDVTEPALARCAPVLGSDAVECVYGRDCLLRHRQLALTCLARLNYHGVLAVNGLFQRSKLRLVLIDK